MLLPYFYEQNISATILAVDSDCCANELDPWQASTLPQNIVIHRAKGLGLRWKRIPGYGSIDSRCHHSLARIGSNILNDSQFDLVYITTTEFGCFRLGPLWKQRHGVPFVLDYQDPWVNDHYRLHPEIRPPGGRVKYFLANRLSRFHEPRVLRQASGYTAVSPQYLSELARRYPFASRIPTCVLPFPGSPLDFEHLQGLDTQALLFDSNDGLIHWVSIGRGGEDLHTALGGLFHALAQNAHEQIRNRLRIHFIGTSYAPAGQGTPTILPLAARYGLAEIVEEHTARVPLSIALATLKSADALLVIGSIDPAYTASKLYPYLLAHRPLLAVVHENSSVVDVLRRCGGGQLATFSQQGAILDLSQQIEAVWLRDQSYCRTMTLDHQAFQAHTAAGQAHQLAAFFNQCLEIPR